VGVVVASRSPMRSRTRFFASPTEPTVETDQRFDAECAATRPRTRALSARWGELHRHGIRLPFKDGDATTGTGLQGALRLPIADSGCLSIHSRRVLERSPILLALWLSSLHDHGHRALSLSTLACCNRYAGQDRLPRTLSRNAWVVRRLCADRTSRPGLKAHPRSGCCNFASESGQLSK
jgi:hypothetical protein